ncbi:flagellar basal-body MS-ring/collar protein FliF [Vibrio owensii]|uniref:flagellar basal-body MS-ring/collar protein FliF n=1 Tax=Vibrio owensii TaxID=696485 RepID=UPI0018F1694F|nr:flagellar basal-body MS-ring/collar protein FliF [Vibrio owensii]
MWTDSQKGLAVVASFAVVASIVVVVMLWTATERYRPLYSTSSNYDSSQILELLDQSGIPYQLSRTDGNILVEESRVYEVRKFLAAKGLKESIPVGMESLDGVSSLGQSQFLEEARYRHALEGELAKSIVTLDSVSFARVHLAVVKSSLFSRNEPTKSSSASVIVNLIQGHDLKSSQIESIINLVSGAVAGLKEENVRIVDQYGRLLSDEASIGDYAMSTSKQRDYQSQIEQRLVRQAADILTPILGPSNFRVQVVADVNFTKVEETEEAYSDPIVRQEFVKMDSSNSTIDLGIPGALSNTPPVTDADVSEETKRTVEKSETTKDYALTGKVTHRVHQQGVIEKLSISVVLNSDYELGEGVEASIAELVEAAVGYSVERGDRLVVSTLPFVPVTDLDVAEEQWYENGQVVDIIKSAIAGLVGLVLIFKVLAPLLKVISPSINKGKAKDLSLNGENQEGTSEVGVKSAEQVVLSDIDMPSPDSPIEDQIKHVQMMATKDTDRVVEVLKRWMNN